MSTTTSVCAIIPARGGSKGIPGKNIVPLAGKPLLAYSIEHAHASNYIERVIVSTDDEAIAQVAVSLGAEAPFTRPAELAGDEVLDLPVFQHALAWLKEHKSYEPEIIVHLRPTSPLREAMQIDEAIQLLMTHPKADSVRSVSIPSQHPYRMFSIGEDGFLYPLMKTGHKEPYLLRRQELPPVYWYNCVVDVTRNSTIFDKNSMTGDYILPYIMDSKFVVDIDGPDDLLVAEVKIKLL
ncbi:acylneuraminate cytidylyltransferase family protein [bacterium]|nr:acylneuraminate cytidylyltransferase family protein [bacterium]